jgi:hypothetical protein
LIYRIKSRYYFEMLRLRLRLRIHHRELIDKRQKAEDRSKQKRTAVRLNKPETRKPEPGTRNTKPGLRLRMRIPHR